MKNECPACGAVYSVTRQHVGRRIACKKCGAALVVEADGIELAGRPRPADVPPTYQEGIPAPPQQLPPFSPAIDNDDQPPPAFRTHTRRSSALVDYLLFRRMLAPVLIQVMFWAGLVGIVIWGLVQLIGALAFIKDAPSAAILLALTAIGQILLGPIFLRVSCECILVGFRIYETLKEMKDKGITLKEK